MKSTLWDKKNYLAPYPYIIAKNIYEYDIKKANISVLYSIGAITKEHYDMLFSLPKIDREIEIGYMLKYSDSLSDKLSEGIKSYRQKLFESNDLSDLDILAIKNDAVFVISKKLTHTRFGIVEFALKNTYSTFLKLNNIEVYFKSDMVNETVQLEIKGISDDKLEMYHHQYMATIIADVLYYAEIGDINEGLTYISQKYNEYIERLLPVGFYRTFDPMSQYIFDINGGKYALDTCDERSKPLLDISCNLNILRQLYGFLTNLYFQRNNK